MPDKSRYQIAPIGSLQEGFDLKVDGMVRRSGADVLPLAAWVDAVIAGASDADANIIAKAIAKRGWLSYGERMAVPTPIGPREPSREPFKGEWDLAEPHVPVAASVHGNTSHGPELRRPHAARHPRR